MNRLVGALAALLVLLATSSASAGGLFITDRGVVPLGRGFASVAGVRDPQALWYNPAGIAWSGQQFLFDATVTLLDADFTRVDGGGNTLPTVQLGQRVLPLPMMAFTQPLGKMDQWTLGLGVYAPNAVLLDYPTYVNADGASCSTPGQDGCGPAPQRYSLYNMNGSALAILEGALSYRPFPELSLAAGGTMLVGTFQAEMAMSACDGTICTYPEDPEFDGYARITAFPIIEPGLTAGFIYNINDVVQIGASILWWFKALDAKADVDVRLPPAAMFNGAYIDGNSARVKAPLPLTVRAGVQVQPIDGLHIEGDLVWEQWSSQNAMTVVPNNIWIRNVLAIGDYQVGTISIPRNMQNVYSVRAGVEYSHPSFQQLQVRVGYNHENSSFQNAYLTPLTLDSTKHILGIGASYMVYTGVWIDVAYGHIFMNDPTVTNSQVLQPNALRPSNTAPSVPVGNGAYNMEGNMFGVGLRFEIDHFMARRQAEEDARIAASMRRPGEEPQLTAPPTPNDTVGATMEHGLDAEFRTPADDLPAEATEPVEPPPDPQSANPYGE